MRFQKSGSRCERTREHFQKPAPIVATGIRWAALVLRLLANHRRIGSPKRVGKHTGPCQPLAAHARSMGGSAISCSRYVKTACETSPNHAMTDNGGTGETACWPTPPTLGAASLVILVKLSACISMPFPGHDC